MFSSIKRKSDNIKSLLRYPAILKQLKQVGDRDIFFFFPHWQIGGAERVHLDIIKVFSNQNPVCFITNENKDEGFKEQFCQLATTIKLDRWGIKKSYKPLLLPKIAKEINRQEKPVVFSSGSSFFYELLPYLENHVKTIDLIHAFTNGDFGPENYSLPYVDRINKRVILGEKTRNDFLNLYQKNNISPELLNRLVIIRNKVDCPKELIKKDYSGDELNILFISRNSPEKRPNLFLEIAELCLKKVPSAKFTMIGPFNHLKGKVSRNIEITGEIADKDILSHYYKKSQLLLVTSEIEGFPMVILEGMCYGVVPVTTDVGEIPAFISEQKYTGFLINSKTTEEEITVLFTNKIATLANDKLVLEKFNQNAFEFVRETFNPEKFEESYRKLFL